MSTFVACLIICICIINNTYAKEINKYKNRFIIGGGLNYLKLDSEFDEKGRSFINNIELSDDDVSFELNARYKIYFNKTKDNSFFITPEVFYNFGSVKADDDKGYGHYSLEVRPDFGARLSLGYEFKQKHALSVGIGFQNMSYKYNYSLRNYNANKKDDEMSFMFSLSYEYNLTDYLSLNLNFSSTYFDFKTPNKNVGTFFSVVDDLESNIYKFGVGMGYRF